MTIAFNILIAILVNYAILCGICACYGFWAGWTGNKYHLEAINNLKHISLFKK